MPIAIAAYTIVAFTFIAYLYTLQHGKEWPDIMILALFSVMFGVGCLHRWLQAFQYLTVSLSIPYVFRSISIDRYLKQGNDNHDVTAGKGSQNGPFNFNNYMEALKQHKKKRERQELILNTTNATMLSTIGLSTILGMINVFIPIITFLVITLATFVASIVLLLVINNQLKAI